MNILSLLEHYPTHILFPLSLHMSMLHTTSSLGHTLASFHSQVCIRNDSYDVPPDLTVITWQWLEAGMPHAEILPCSHLQEDL